MADHLSDEEQLQVLKNWWSENGRFLIGAIAIGLTAYFGWQWWTQYQKDYSEGAAAIYTDLSETVATANGEDLTEEQQKTAQFLIEQLQSDYENTLYAANASMLAAKLAVEKDDLPTAESELKKALHYNDEDVNTIASLRLAKVYLAQEKYDEALVMATYDKNDAFAATYAVLRGDVLLAKGDIELARNAYQQAMGLLTANPVDRNSGLQRQLLEVKLSNLPAVGDQS